MGGLERRPHRSPGSQAVPDSMKFRHPIWELVTCLWLAVAVASQAQTALDWKFSSSANPSFPTTTNPPTVVATATFLSGNYTYLPSGPFGLYGPPTGLWGLAALDATPGVVEFRLADLVPVTTVNLSLELYHFVDSPDRKSVV